MTQYKVFLMNYTIVPDPWNGALSTWVWVAMRLYQKTTMLKSWNIVLVYCTIYGTHGSSLKFPSIWVVFRWIRCCGWSCQAVKHVKREEQQPPAADRTGTPAAVLLRLWFLSFPATATGKDVLQQPEIFYRSSILSFLQRRRYVQSTQVHIIPHWQ